MRKSQHVLDWARVIWSTEDGESLEESLEDFYQSFQLMID